MAATITINDQATPQLKGVRTELQSKGMLLVAGRAVANKLRSHFEGLQQSRPNKRGFPRTNFWAQVRRSVQNPVSKNDNAVSISINHVGLALRRFGGTLVPKNAKRLTIPLTAKSYGKRAREFDDLTYTRRGNTEFLQDEKGELQYLLKKRVVQKPDPSVLPTDNELADTAVSQIRKRVARAARRGGNS